MGYTVVDAPSVITTHVTKVVKDYASDLLSREDVKNMLEKLKEHNETVVTEISGQLPTGVVHRVLQRLLDEKVPIHDLAAVLEIVSDYSAQTKDPVILCEFARQALKGHIVARHIGEDRTLYAVTLAPELEEEIQGSITQGSGGGILSLPPERAAEITDEIKNTLEGLSGSVESDIVLLVSPLIRLHMFRLLDRKIDDVTVLSYSEISDDIPLKALHTIRVNSEGLNAA
jgi:flagellar biosynthesis protein FlhA